MVWPPRHVVWFLISRNRDLFLNINNLIVRSRQPALHLKTGLARHPVKGMCCWKHQELSGLCFLLVAPDQGVVGVTCYSAGKQRRRESKPLLLFLFLGGGSSSRSFPSASSSSLLSLFLNWSTSTTLSTNQDVSVLLSLRTEDNSSPGLFLELQL